MSSNKENGLLWEITGNGLEKPSYLFGTIHLPVEAAFFDDINKFEESFNSSECVLMEVDSVDTETLQKLSMKTGRLLPDTISYTDLLDDADLHFLDSLLQKDLNIKNLNTKLQPYFLHRRIIEAYSQKQDSVVINNDLVINFQDNRLLMDFYIRKVAKEKGKKTIGLDDLEREFWEKFGMPLAKSARQMVNILRYENEILMNADSVIHFYINQDLFLVSEYIKRKNHYVIADSLKMDDLNGVKRRNIAWMKTIIPAMNDYSCFIAVGAGHLLSEYGLIDLLRKEGYTVEPVK